MRMAFEFKDKSTVPASKLVTEMRRLKMINWLLMPDPFYLHLPNITIQRNLRNSWLGVGACVETTRKLQFPQLCVISSFVRKNSENRHDIHFWTYKIPLKKKKKRGQVTILHILDVLLLPGGIKTRTQSFRLRRIVSAFLIPNYFFDFVSASSVSESLSQSFMVAPIIKSSLRTLQLGFPGPDSTCNNHKYRMSAHFNSLHHILIVHPMAFQVLVKYTII